MPIGPGVRLGPYEIVTLLGAGGMGEVYRARDTRLDRTVAIKILPPEFAGDPDRRARFEREARAISQLNHPHICSLFDIGEAVPTGPQSPAQPGLRRGESAPSPSSVNYLVMEHLEGETLAARLDRAPLPLAEALRIGGEIASALDSAHRHGIVHRDLKPANVMLVKGAARSGAAQAKLMDFGLARPVALVGQTGATTESQTVRRPLTAEGMIVGTLQYMAPEQLEGKESDARTDLWALGCVLYEMATGKRAFAGTSQASLIAAILQHDPPPITATQPLSPPALDRVVRQCLEKDPEDRWQSARDVSSELGWIAGSTSGALPVIVGGRSRSRKHLVGEVIAAVALAFAFFAVGFLLAGRLTVHRPADQALIRFVVTAPAGLTVQTDGTAAAISPDGRRLAFVAVDSTGVPRLWIRALDTFPAQAFPGTDNAFFPFWSPDSRFVAFWSDGKLRKVPAGGGAAEVICDASDFRGGTWNKDGVIVFAPQIAGPLLRVSASGGETVEVARPDSARGETALRWPGFLPDGRHFLYVSLPARNGSYDVYVGALGSTESRRLMTAGSAPVYAEPGYLLFASGDRLVARQFDAERLQLMGDVVPIGDVAPYAVSEGAYLLSASVNGVLAHVSTTPPDTQLVWLDRAGRTLDAVALPAASYARPFLSPDDRRAIVAKSSSPRSADLWLVDLERPVASPLTFDGSAASSARGDSLVFWSPDGGRVTYQCGGYDICEVPTTGAGLPEPLIQQSGVFHDPSGFSPDGRYVVFSRLDEGKAYDLYLLPLQGDRKPVRYLHTPFNAVAAAVSPDGHWLAYASDETGRSEVYVRSFPEPGEKYPISMAGGGRAQWSKDGRELLIYTGSDLSHTVGPVYAVDVQTTPTFKAKTPRLLFTPRRDVLGLAATSDLQRFLAAVPVEGASPASITVVLNWQAALKER
jgi:Tol biopolymer transport system component